MEHALVPRSSLQALLGSYSTIMAFCHLWAARTSIQARVQSGRGGQTGRLTPSLVPAHPLGVHPHNAVSYGLVNGRQVLACGRRPLGVEEEREKEGRESGCGVI